MNNYSFLSTVIWIVFLGICFGAFYAYYHRRLLGDLLRAIISAGAEDEKTAKTLEEIGYGSGIKRTFAGFVLKKGSALRKTVEAVYEEQIPVKKNQDELFVKAPAPAEEQRYYIPEEKRITAEIRYDGEGTTASTVLLTVAVFFVVAIITMSLLPWILQNFNKLFGGGDDVPAENETEITEDIGDGEDSSIDYNIE